MQTPRGKRRTVDSRCRKTVRQLPFVAHEATQSPEEKVHMSSCNKYMGREGGHEGLFRVIDPSLADANKVHGNGLSRRMGCGWGMKAKIQ